MEVDGVPDRRRRRRGRWVRVVGWTVIGLGLVLFGLHHVSGDPYATDRRYGMLKAHLAHPHYASEAFENRIRPALQAAIVGDEFDGNEMTFIGNSFPANVDQSGGPGSYIPNDYLRHWVVRAYGSTGDEFIAKQFEWDDAVIASLDAGGRMVADQAHLLSLFESDFAAELRAVEDRTEQRARHDLTWLRWQRAYLIAADGVFPVVGLLLLLIGPFVLVVAVAADELGEADRRRLREAVANANCADPA